MKNLNTMKRVLAGVLAMFTVAASMPANVGIGDLTSGMSIIADASFVDDYEMTIAPQALDYTGEEQTVSITVRAKGQQSAKPFMDYTILNNSNKATTIGTHTVTIEKNNSDETITGTFEIVAPDLNGNGLSNQVQLDSNSFYVFKPSTWDNIYLYTWDGEIKPNNSWPGEEMTAVEGVEGLYTLPYPDSTNPVHFIFNDGDNKQTANLESFTREDVLANVFRVSDDKEVSFKSRTSYKAEIVLKRSSFAATGNEITDVIDSIKFGGKTLTTDDYDVSYENNTDVGTGTVTVTGKGNYTGSVSKTFKIVGTPLKTAENTCVGTSGICNPKDNNQSHFWEGDYVYYGQYPLDNNGGEQGYARYRVLDPQSGDYGVSGGSMLLDCDYILYYTSFNDMGLNDNSFLNKPGVFTDIEKNAIAESRKEAGNQGAYSAFFNGAALNGEKIFLLEAADVINNKYGYSSNNNNARFKYPQNYSFNTGWWLRSPYKKQEEKFGFIPVQLFGDYPYFGGGNIDECYHYSNYGVSPAFNVKLSDILFSTKIKNTKYNNATDHTEGAEYKLTLKDTSKTIKVTEDKSVLKSGNIVTVPYTVTDDSTNNRTKTNNVSVLFVNKEYDQERGFTDSNILYYAPLDLNGDEFSLNGTGAFTIPNQIFYSNWEEYFPVHIDNENENEYCSIYYEYSWGEKQPIYIYILAEHIGDIKELTDYASEPVEIKIPKHIHNFSSYAVNSAKDTLTAMCSTNGCDLTNNKISLKLSSPANTTYDGNDKEAELSGLDEFNSETGLTLSENSIQYYQKIENTYSSNAMTSKPKNAGDYKAVFTVTISEKTYTLEKEFTINPKAPAADDFTFTPPSNLGYNDESKTASVTSDAIGMGSIVVKYSSDNGTTWSENAPKNVGKYKVGITVASGTNYEASTDIITNNSWEFTINIDADDITADLVFEGNENPEAVNVKYGDIELQHHEEYGDNSVTIILDGDYSGSKTINYKHFTETEPTHTKNGNIDYYSYDGVNYIKENDKFKKATDKDITIPSTSINSSIRVQTSRIEPTSEKDGYIITKIYCADCGKLISYKRVKIPKLS